MQLYKCKLSDVAKVEISSVDKKAKDGETPVRLCNFTDVYHNWAITSEMACSFMEADFYQPCDKSEFSGLTTSGCNLKASVSTRI